MEMEPFVQRMIEEEKDLRAKIAALNAFSSTPPFIGLSPFEQFALLTQRDAMEMYHGILGARIRFYQQKAS